MKEFFNNLEKNIKFLSAMIPIGIITTLLLSSIWFVIVGVYKVNSILIFTGISIISVMFIIMVIAAGWFWVSTLNYEQSRVGSVMMILITITLFIYTPVFIGCTIHKLTTNTHNIEINKNLN